MGLFYQFPSRLDPADDRIRVEGDTLIIKTYGPPGIFWVYLVAIFSVMFFLGWASRNSLSTMWDGTDFVNRMLVVGVGLLMGSLIPALLGIFFYEKILCKNKRDLKVIHRIFGIPLKCSRHKLLLDGSFEIVHCLDSPNMARREGQEEGRGFQNNGFYQLKALVGESAALIVDRHSHSRELRKLKDLLCQY